MLAASHGGCQVSEELRGGLKGALGDSRLEIGGAVQGLEFMMSGLRRKGWGNGVGLAVGLVHA